MSLAVTFRRAARTELIAAARWYEARRPKLGAEFIAEIDRCVARAADNPQLFAEVYKSVRRVTAERFPYSVYFREEKKRIVVLAVFHGSRDPIAWQVRG